MARGAIKSGRGFTLVEALLLTGALGASAAVVGVAGNAQPKWGGTPAQQPKQPPASTPAPPSFVDALARARASARQLKCAAQVRGITQALVVWASNNNSMYPMPSEIDKTNDTVADLGRAKNTTANIYSLLIYNGNISPEICICPEEHGASVKLFKDYEYSSPKKAVKPATALWDPAFSADFAGGTGNASYAHLEPSGDLYGQAKDAAGMPIKGATGRMQMWSDTYNTSEAAVGDRGPEIQSVEAAKPDDVGSYKAKTKLAESVTFKNHGDPKTWEGNIGFNDAHVDFLTTLGPPAKPDTHLYKTKEGAMRADTIFFDEPDDGAATNTFLGIFTKAGKTPGEFHGIWD